MEIDPDGEFVQFLVPMIIAGYANVVAQGMSGNIDNVWQLFGAFGKGAATSALSAGAGMGISAGLNAMGVGVQASNFIGGTLGSFSGNILTGGMPTSTFGWASAIGSASLMGSIQAKTNPFGLSQGYDATAVDYGMLDLGDDIVDLAPQTIKALEEFGIADWHKLFASGANEVVGGVYGAHDAFANNPFGGAILSAPEMVGGQMAFNVASKWVGGFSKIMAARTGTQSFKSFSAFKRAMGPAGKGKAWHHIVEQNPANIAKFGPEAIHNTGNLMKLPHGAGTIHAKISGHYSSIQGFTGGKTVRQWLNTKSFDFQRNYGLKKLKEFGWTP